MRISQCPRPLIKMNVVQNKKDAFSCWGNELKERKLETRLGFWRNFTAIRGSEHVFNFTVTLQSAVDGTLCCVLSTVVMTLIRSGRRGASSLFMCSRGVRWNQSRPGGARGKTLAGLHDTPLPPPPPPPPPARPVSQSVLDDGALPFRVERALKVRVGQRPTCLILAGFCRRIQEDKWTFDTHRCSFDKQTLVCLHFTIAWNQAKPGGELSANKWIKVKHEWRRTLKIHTVFLKSSMLFRRKMFSKRFCSPLTCQKSNLFILTRRVQAGVCEAWCVFVEIQVCYRQANRGGQLERMFSTWVPKWDGNLRKSQMTFSCKSAQIYKSHIL